MSIFTKKGANKIKFLIGCWTWTSLFMKHKKFRKSPPPCLRAGPKKNKLFKFSRYILTFQFYGLFIASFEGLFSWAWFFESEEEIIFLNILPWFPHTILLPYFPNLRRYLVYVYAVHFHICSFCLDRSIVPWFIVAECSTVYNYLHTSSNSMLIPFIGIFLCSLDSLRSHCKTCFIFS